MPEGALVGRITLDDFMQKEIAFVLTGGPGGCPRLRTCNGSLVVKGHAGLPEGDGYLPALIDRLALESMYVDRYQTFADWCRARGVDPEWRLAKRRWLKHKSEAVKLRDMLGDRLYNLLLWRTERLPTR